MKISVDFRFVLKYFVLFAFHSYISVQNYGKQIRKVSLLSYMGKHITKTADFLFDGNAVYIFVIFCIYRAKLKEMQKWFYLRNGVNTFRTLYIDGSLYTRVLPTSESSDLYQILKVSPRASQKQIKAAYYKLSLILHPDKNNDSKAAHDKFTKLNEAYAILGNATSRKHYDRSQRVDHHTTSPFHNDELRIHKTAESRRYDSWTRTHYQSALMQRDERIKRDKLRHEETSEEVAAKRSRFSAVFGVLSITTVIHFIMKYRRSKK